MVWRLPPRVRRRAARSPPRRAILNDLRWERMRFEAREKTEVKAEAKMVASMRL